MSCAFHQRDSGRMSKTGTKAEMTHESFKVRTL